MWRTGEVNLARYPSIGNEITLWFIYLDGNGNRQSGVVYYLPTQVSTITNVYGLYHHKVEHIVVNFQTNETWRADM